MYNFGVDIGGTNIKIGMFKNEKLIKTISIPTDISDNGKNIINDISNTILNLVNINEIKGIGVGVAAYVDNNKHVIASNIGWYKLDLKSKFIEKFPNVSIEINNDAYVGCLGEMYYGNAKDGKNFIYICMGTGIGGAIVVSRNILPSPSGEIGHIKVAFNNKRECSCGLKDCLEVYSSATGIVNNYYELTHKRGLDSKQIYDLAIKGDKMAITAFDNAGYKMAVALSMLSLSISPEYFVFSGGLSKSGRFYIDLIQKHYKKLCLYMFKNVEFRLSSLIDDAGIYGAMRSVK